MGQWWGGTFCEWNSLAGCSPPYPHVKGWFDLARAFLGRKKPPWCGETALSMNEHPPSIPWRVSPASEEEPTTPQARQPSPRSREETSTKPAATLHHFQLQQLPPTKRRPYSFKGMGKSREGNGIFVFLLTVSLESLSIPFSLLHPNSTQTCSSKAVPSFSQPLVTALFLLSK